VAGPGAPTWRAAPAALVIHALLVLWLTWPLVARVGAELPNTRLACRVDTLLAGWTLAWETHALATDPSRVLDANIYHPDPHALLYGPTFLAALPIFAPAFLATGNPVLALNLSFLVGLVLTAAALHVVAYRWTASHLAGAIAGLVFLTTRWTLQWWLPTAPPFALLELFPFIILVASRPFRGARDAVVLAVLVAAQGLTDVRYTTAAIVLPLGVLAAFRLALPRTRAAGARTAVAVALGLVLLAPIFAVHFDVRRRNPAIEEQTVWTIPPMPVRLPGGLMDENAPTGVPLASLVLIIAGAALRWTGRGREATPDAAWHHAALWTIAGSFFAISAFYTPSGAVVRMPFTVLLDRLGLQLVLRAPLRLGLGALMGAALLAALAFATCAATIARAARPGALRALAFAAVATTLVAEYRWGLPGGWRPPIPAAYPLAAPPAMAPAIADVLRAAPAPTLELPAAIPFQQTPAMWRSIGGWWPLVNGYSGYFPAAFPERMALAARLPDAAALGALVRDTQLAWVVVRTGDMGFSPARTVWGDLAARPSGALRLVARAGADLLFAVAPRASELGVDELERALGRVDDREHDQDDVEEHERVVTE